MSSLVMYYILSFASFFPGKCAVNDLFKVVFKMKDDVMMSQSWLKYSCNTVALEELLKEILGEDTKMEDNDTK